VIQVTDNKELAKDVRKKKQIQTASKKTNDTKIIKLADKTSNMRAITFSPAPNWSVKRRLEYIGWAREVVKGLRGARPGSSNNSTMPPPKQKARSPFEAQSYSEDDAVKAR
jgi:hypothetical protein